MFGPVPPPPPAFCRRLIPAAVALLVAGALPAQEAAIPPGSLDIGRVVIARETPQADSCSAAYRAIETDALERHFAGDTAGAMGSLSRLLTSAVPADAAAIRLRLGYMARKLERRDEARQHFEQAAAIRPGINDAIRGEAALRLGYLLPKDEATTILQKIVSGEYAVALEGRCEAAQLLGAYAHRDRHHRTAIGYFQAIADTSTATRQIAHARCELAGLWFELANGGGVDGEHIDEALRPAAWDKARSFARQVMDTTDTIARDRRMVAELMHFETFWFQDRHAESYEGGKTFLGRWSGLSTETLKPNERKYLTTARTFHMQNAFVLGHLEEAEAMALELIADPPSKSVQFQRSDAYLYALAVARLVAQEHGDRESPAKLRALAAEHRPDMRYFYSIANTLQNRRTRNLSATAQ